VGSPDVEFAFAAAERAGRSFSHQAFGCNRQRKARIYRAEFGLGLDTVSS